LEKSEPTKQSCFFSWGRWLMMIANLPGHLAIPKVTAAKIKQKPFSVNNYRNLPRCYFPSK
jgi:hypothetical protein